MIEIDKLLMIYVVGLTLAKMVGFSDVSWFTIALPLFVLYLANVALVGVGKLLHAIAVRQSV